MSKPIPHSWHKDIAYLLYDTSRLIRRRCDERFVDLGLSEAQWRVIGFLNKAEGLTQTELALLLGIQKAPLGEHIDKLEAMGWLVRRRDANDRRVNRLYLQDIASQRAVDIQQRFNVFVQDMRSVMLEDAWQGLQRTLADLVSGFCADQTQTVVSRLNVDSNIYLIGVLSRQVRKRFDGELKKLGFTRSQWLVLRTVINEEGICQTDLGKLLDIPKAPLGQVLDELQQKGWLERKQDDSDRRVKRLGVAEDAKLAMKQVMDNYQQLHREMVEVLGTKDLEILEAGLTQLRAGLLKISPNRRSADT
jgi:MarR family transcriptional regulator, transcriptional regulator for hemolysin